MQTKALKRDFTSGPIFWRLTTYSIPIMLTGLLQILYSMADNIVVGRFSGDDLALAAISSSNTLTNTLINIMLGFSLGAGILISQYYGAKNEEAVSRSVHTSMTFSAIVGLAFGALGFIFARPILMLLKVPAELIDNALLYVRIILAGVPAQAIYNFAASILRSVGDSKTPLIILSASGLLNVLLNLLFVIVFKMSIVGVAIATIVSQYASVIASVVVLMRRNTCYKLSLKKLRIEKKILLRITKLGLPSAIQSAAFNLSGMVLTSSVNELGAVTIYAFGVSNQIEAIAYNIMNSYQVAAMTFTAQNYGALKINRIKRVTFFSIFWVATVGILMGQLVLLFSEPLANLYISSDNVLKNEIIEAAKPMLTVMLCTYFLCGIMNVMTGITRGLGYSILSMIICVSCVVGGRLIWVLFIYPLEPFYKNTAWLLTAFPFSWTIAGVLFAGILTVLWFKLKKMHRISESSKKLSESV